MEEWKTYRIGDICKTNTSQYSTKETWDEFLYLDTGNITRNTIDEIARYSSNAELPSRARRKVISDDIIFSTVRPNQCHFGILSNPPANLLVSTGFTVITANKEIVDPYYLYYYLTQDSIVDYLHSIGEQAVSAYPSIKAQDIEDLEIELPDLSTQNNIAKTLRALDEKIQLNRQINDNLELQAQTLYKSWFVDFEPFQNGKFIESELGLIPEGWKIGKINDVINLLSGFPFKSSDFQENGDYQLITIKGVQDGYLDVTSADRLSSLPSKMPQYCILNIGDILISLTGNVGRICIVDRNNLLLNQRVAILSPKNIRDSFYAYTMFRSESMKNELIHLARGTAQLNLSPIETGEKLTVIPPDNILEAFAKVGKGTFNQYISLKMENIRLMEMRDSLLPKLMSGELKINEIDC